MKGMRSNKLKEYIIPLLVGIIPLVLILGVGYLLLDQVKEYNGICLDENNTFKVGLQEHNCSITTDVYEIIKIEDKCYINCSVQMEAISKLP